MRRIGFVEVCEQCEEDYRFESVSLSVCSENDLP